MLPLCTSKVNEDSSVSALTDEERGQIVEQIQKGGERLATTLKLAVDISLKVLCCLLYDEMILFMTEEAMNLSKGKLTESIHADS